ncbi:WD repeat and HMG-box DNA-binding protein 1 [Frankliniella fusca]|uniref:WD repeat and HMG-box DNA-binding protein 1 n=1 Tax=Frankliniella fusca TaxID=407009 RepID=A0AAE1LT44_9NEOP|nr:WD repeat and HMG-box DNA-binding protein 1 [Frankliniella fusca]
MPPVQKPIRYAHSEGHTDVAYSDTGKYIITSGHDGEVRIWAGIEDDDNHTLCVAEEKANAVVQHGDRMFVSTDDNWVQAYTFPEYKRDGVITRFTAPVTDIAVSASGKFLVAGSCDMEIHISNLETSEPDIVLVGHTAPVLGLSVDPKEEYLVSSSCDGTVKVWDIEMRDSVKIWDCVPKANDFFTAPVLVRASWQPSGRNFLAVPHDKEVRIYERSTWTEVATLSSSSCSEPFSITSFSPCGKYLAAVSHSIICVWDVKNFSLVTSFTHERGQKICGLEWNPKVEGELAYCDVMGQLGTIENLIPKDGAKANTKPIPPEIESSSVPANDINDMNALHDLEGLGFDDDDDDDNENAFSIDKIKSQLSMNLGDADDKESRADDDVRSVISGSTRVGLKLNTQPTFQPSSTPESLQHRFMVWNNVGIIRCINNHEENSIDIRFHDTAVHHSIHMNNILGHTVASMSTQAVVLACPSTDDTQSKVVCIALNAWDGTQEWMTTLPNGESAVAVAVGNSWLAVATDTHNLRLLCLAGTQRQVLATPGALVCLSGYKDKLLVVFHRGVGLPDEQNLWYQLMTVTPEGGLFCGPTQPLPLSPGATLKWAGFTDECSPCTLDSEDILRFLPARSHCWMPICDTKEHAKGQSDHFFIVGISEQYQNIRAVLCRGAFYPPTTPLPIVSELPFQLPFCEMETEKSKLEETLWRSQLMLTTMKTILDTSTHDEDLLLAEKYRTEAEKNIKESLIKLFALSTRGGLEMRAVELCHLMPSAQVAELAAKYAMKVGKSMLAERVTTIVSNKRDREESRVFSARSRSPDLFASQSQSQGMRAPVDDISNGNYEDTEGGFGADKENEIERENLLLAAKRKRAALEADTVEIKPAVLLQSQKRLNPFKKATVLSNEAKGLDRLSSPYSSPQEVKKKSLVSMSKGSSSGASKVSKPQSKQMTLFGTAVPSNSIDVKKSDEVKKKKPAPFMTWFSKIKSELQEEFPDVDPSELTKIGMKRYKEYKEGLNEAPLEEEVSTPETKRQKLECYVPTLSSESEPMVTDCNDDDESAALLAAATEEMVACEETESCSNEKPLSSENTKSGIGKLKAFSFTSKS